MSGFSFKRCHGNRAARATLHYDRCECLRAARLFLGKSQDKRGDLVSSQPYFSSAFLGNGTKMAPEAHICTLYRSKSSEQRGWGSVLSEWADSDVSAAVLTERSGLIPSCCSMPNVTQDHAGKLSCILAWEKQLSLSVFVCVSTWPRITAVHLFQCQLARIGLYRHGISSSCSHRVSFTANSLVDEVVWEGILCVMFVIHLCGHCENNQNTES